MPDVPELIHLINYFDPTYVTGVARPIRRPQAGRSLVLRVRKSPPMFPSAMWNVHEATLVNDERTNNVCEGWNHAFAGLVGHAHPSIWVLLEAIQMDEATVATDIMNDGRGQPPTKRVKRVTRDHQQRLQQLCADRRDGRKSVSHVLRVLGHCVRVHAGH